MPPKTQPCPVMAQKSANSQKHNAWLSQNNRNVCHKRGFFSRLLDQYRAHIESIQKWFYREFPPVSAVRLEKWDLCKMVKDSGKGYTALARHLNESATQVIQEVVRASEGIPPRRLNPKKLKDRLAVFGYGGKAETIIADAVALCRSGSQPFGKRHPFDVNRVKEYLRRWQKEQR